MKEELIIIEDGEINVNGNSIFTDLQLQIYKSEIIGIVFDNVNERKHLLEIFRGERALYGGKVFVGSKRYDYDKARNYFTTNITIIEKQSKLIDNFSIEENIFIFADNNNFISNKKLKFKLHALIAKFNLEIPYNRSINTLSTKERIIIELLKAFYEDKKIVVFNYVSTILLNNDYAEVYILIKRLKELGMTFILIESYNNFIFEWVSSYFLIQQGKTSGIFESNSYNTRKLNTILIENSKPVISSSINSMIQENEKKNDYPILEFKNISTNYIENISFLIKSGEILKIFLMDDDSYEHIINILKGIIKPVSGDILLRGKKLDIKNVHYAVRKGICFIEEYPYEDSLSYHMTVKDNLGILLSNKVPFFWLKRRYLKSLNYLIKHFDLDKYSDVKIKNLDSRTIQITAYLKLYLYAPNVVICIKPFTEMDINLQEITKEMILYLKSRGISVIILTTILSETRNIKGNSIYINKGKQITENELFQYLYKR